MSSHRPTSFKGKRSHVFSRFSRKRKRTLRYGTWHIRNTAHPDPRTVNLITVIFGLCIVMYNAHIHSELYYYVRNSYIITNLNKNQGKDSDHPSLHTQK